MSGYPKRYNSSIMIQARISSNRFPGKMLEKINNVTLLEYVYARCKASKNTDNVIVITSIDKSDDAIYDLCLSRDIPVFRGDLDDVLQRYVDAAIANNINLICRVSGDSPFVDVQAIDEMISCFNRRKGYDYIYTMNCLNGFVSEVFPLSILNKINNKNLTNEDREHVTTFIRKSDKLYNIYKMNLRLRPKRLEKYTLTIDYPDDILIANKVASQLSTYHFKSQDIINILSHIDGKRQEKR